MGSVIYFPSSLPKGSPGVGCASWQVNVFFSLDLSQRPRRDSMPSLKGLYKSLPLNSRLLLKRGSGYSLRANHEENIKFQ